MRDADVTVRGARHDYNVYVLAVHYWLTTDSDGVIRFSLLLISDSQMTSHSE